MKLTTEQIYASMNPGQRYQAAQLGKRHKVSAASIAASLDTLVHYGMLRSEIVSRKKVWYVPHPAHFVPMRPVKPYQMSREMKAAAERCAELRVHPSKFN
jgi:hypothetical protein